MTVRLEAAGCRRCMQPALLVLLCCLLVAVTALPACVAAAADGEPLDVATAMTLSYYDLLGVSTQATAKEIKKASDTQRSHRRTPGCIASRLYRPADSRLARHLLFRRYRVVALRYHPDKVPDESLRESTHALFLRINAANEALSSDTLRAQYDQLLADGVVDYSDHEYKLYLRRQDERNYGRYQAYAMRAARGDIEWGELAVMIFSLLCAVGPVVKWQWSEWKKSEKAKEKAKESVRRGKRDVEAKMKGQQKLEDELARRRAAAVRPESSDDDEDDATDSEERRREKEARRARVKKVRAAVRAVLMPYTAAAEESKAVGRESIGSLPSEDVELLVRDLSVEELEVLSNQLDDLTSEDKRRAADVIALFNEEVSAHFTPTGLAANSALALT